ncbi:probable leucine--tRNA ligase, mitochondrial [Planococcus citri]|uniref:probable leucine--tRNA ligase, mitochondrial n=1 Tax=Planococcus citri TaxID=170843 RepID=UPI0031F750D5
MSKILSTMQIITLMKRRPPVTVLFRSISTEIWNNHLDLETRKKIEGYWKKQFSNDNLFDKNNLNDKFYVLSMFPYPSGNLHMGHVRVYTISDTIARFHRMNGKNVYQPIGWDAFGLPAENAAFERGIAPDEWTRKNISQMKSHLDSLHLTFDWDSELSTCDPRYYRWTQYIFLKMYEAGLVYQKKALVNWDPVDETVLAEEQVDEEGKSWRSGAKVEKKVLKQWFIRTTKFAKNLRDGLNDKSLVNWKDIIDVQKNWIGECNGYSFELPIENRTDGASLNVWVTEPKSILFAEFIVVKPNSMIDILAGSSQEKDGQLDLNVINPFTKTKIPIFVSDEVEYPFGRDVYVGVPSKIDLDKEFALKKGLKLSEFSSERIYDDDEICRIAQQMQIGGYPVSSKLNDWLISRQRYWGTPIPIVHCSTCGPQPVPYDQLPVTLPSLPKDHPVGKGLHKILEESDWKNTSCPKCGGKASKECDTMDTFVDSSWYYLRYPEVNNTSEPFSEKTASQMMPVDVYVGGKEHAVLHLYYARFVSHFLHSIGLLKHREPFQRLLCQGMVKGLTYKNSEGRYFKPSEVEVKLPGKKAVCKDTNEDLIVSWEKMSKSKHNGVEPSDVLNEYGVDTTRLFLLFSVAPFSHRNWNDSLFSDVITWQHRLWLTMTEFLKCRNTPLESEIPGFNMEAEEQKLIAARNKCVRLTTYNYKVTHQLAAAITNLQSLTNTLRNSKREVRKYSKEYEKCLAYFIIMLAPMTPHFAATLWHGFTSAPGHLLTDCDEINWNENVMKQKWPKLDKDYILPFKITINGDSKVYTSKLQYNSLVNLTPELALEYAVMHPTVKKYVYKKDVYEVELEKDDCFGASINIKVNNSRFYEDVDSSDSESEIGTSKS